MSDKKQDLNFKLDLEKLIGRNFSHSSLEVLKEQTKGKTVVVTGAGGSIGSEIVNQLSKLDLRTLILIDHSEFNLYRIHDQILQSNIKPGLIILPCLLNITNKFALDQLFTKHKPDYIYHAAAYKHVHLVEYNPFAGISNNILGTKNLMELAAAYDVEKFILISTDKAVRPTNLMGATKRICELMLTKFAREKGLNMSAVRFGNVAGSSGSLIPKLFEQIKKQKPLTITDKRMTRYFMLIPEAVELVLKSSETSQSGDIVLLNMGHSVKILDIADRLISMCGLDPQAYPKNFVGARPGEKLFEELSLEAKELFKNGETFVTLPNGDKDFAVFKFKNKTYHDIDQVVNQILFYAKNHSSTAIDLVWESIKVDFENNQEEAQEDTKRSA